LGRLLRENNDRVTFAAVVIAGYLLGSCPWGYWLVRIFRHRDIRASGSGGIGITNVWRSYGPTLGVPLVFLDFGKGYAPAVLALHEVSRTAAVAAGAAAMVGHWRPLFLGFAKGGKMIATGGGAFFAVAPLVAGSGLGIWLATFWLLGYSSVASLATAIFMPIGSWLFGYPRVVIAFAGVALVTVWALHRDNLRRLWRGTEPRASIALVPRLRLLLS
jgi:glycerol-3-phosphate acyltransferase PlsY